MDLARMRELYGDVGLSEDDLDPDPIVMFRNWYDQWSVTGPYDASAVVLATVSADGRPSARAVLLKSFDERGFVFHTNHDSAKGRDLRISGRAALCFLWHPVERQVRVVGEARHLPGDESDAYFASRPRGAQLAAWASPQSQVVADRAELERRMAAVAERFEAEVPRPPHWGGYLVDPTEIEFWQGRPNRFHDRLRYRRSASGWTIERLAP